MKKRRRLVAEVERMRLDQARQRSEPCELPLDPGALLGVKAKAQHLRCSGNVGRDGGIDRSRRRTAAPRYLRTSRWKISNVCALVRMNEGSERVAVVRGRGASKGTISAIRVGRLVSSRILSAR